MKFRKLLALAASQIVNNFTPNFCESVRPLPRWVSMFAFAVHVRTPVRRAVMLAAGLSLLVSANISLRAEEASASGDISQVVRTLNVSTPLMAVVSLRDQRVVIYDAIGEILRAPISSGQPGHETPAGLFTVIQKEAEHYSNLYDDASMPFMQRITWSGIALHAGPLPGRPASHGCIRMPLAFAEQLFGLTHLGMRVVVSRSSIVPRDIMHPALFQPVAASEVTSEGAVTGEAILRRLALQKSTAEKAKAEADTAVQSSDAAAIMARKLAIVAARSTIANRSIFGAKARAEDQLATAETILASSDQPQLKRLAELSKQRAEARIAQINTEIEGERADPGAKAAAATRAAEQAQEAYDAKIATLLASRKLNRRMKPVSVFISRQEQKLYVRQSFEPVLDIPIVIRNADKPIGTHLFTAVGYSTKPAVVRWTSLSMPRPGNKAGDKSNDPSSDAKAALDRIEIPQEVRDRISEVLAPGSSLIISDELMHKETSTGTDFVVIMSSELQGGILSRQRPPTTVRPN